MLTHWVLLALALVGAGIIAFAMSLRRTLRRITPAGYSLREFARMTTESGYLAPSPNEEAVQFLRRLTGWMTWIQVGKVTVVNPEKLDAVPGPCIITPNHGSDADPGLWPNISSKPLRYMAARGVFTAFWNWMGLIVGACGGFVADLERGKGHGAAEAAVKVLCQGESLVLFPEGWAWLDGVVRPFKKGAVRIVKEAAKRAGRPFYLLPVYIRFGRYPGPWILRFPPPVQYFLVFVLFWYYRRGVTVVLGDYISSDDLTEDDAADTIALRETVLALDPHRN
jgi:1-acyl-sn-glycerol-3-phosphate acyltransferase